MKIFYATIITLGALSLVFVVLAELIRGDSFTIRWLRRYAAICSSVGFLGILSAAWKVTPSQVPTGTLLGFLLPSIFALTIYVARNHRP
jgi:hypothetical protein